MNTDRAVTQVEPTQLEEGYYATPDPDDPGVITCWRWTTEGRRRGLRPWTGGASYGTSAAPSRGRPSGPVTLAVRKAYAAWFLEVVASVRRDPVAARTRFGQITGHCCICGRALTEPESVSLGIGPECRRAA